MTHTTLPIFLRTFITALALGAVTFTVAGAADKAEAYVWYEATDSPVSCAVDAESCIPMRWFRTELEYRFSTVQPEDVDWDAMLGVLERSFAQWDIPGSKVPQIDYAGTTDVTQRTTPEFLTEAPDNVVVFIPSKSDWQALGNSPSWLAITLIAHNTATGEIIDADIEINDAHHTFSIADAPPNGTIDLVSTLTHEAGHFFGMDHSLDQNATMYGSYTGGDPTQARDLVKDDEDGIFGLYQTVPEPVEPKPPADDGCAGGGPVGGLFFGLIGAFVAIRQRF